MTVDGTNMLSYSGVKMAQDWTKYFRPLVKTRKVFAVVRIGIKDSKGKVKFLWCDARDLSIASTLKGLGETKCIGDLIF